MDEFYDHFPEAHDCEQPGCSNDVLYDDEPYCFTHSPDSGSTVIGYSHKNRSSI